MSDLFSFFLYCFIFILASAMISYGMTRQNIASWYFSLTGLLSLILFSSLRWNVGTDFVTYFSMFRSYAESPFGKVILDNITEPVYPILCKSVSCILGSGEQGFVAVQILFFSFIILVSWKAIERLKLIGSQFLAIFTYCFGMLTFSFNAVRQGGRLSENS